MSSERGYRNDDGQPCPQKVSDDELVGAVERAESRAVNGEAHPETIAEEVDLSQPQVAKRLRRLEEQGRVERHCSIKAYNSGTVKTAVVTGGEGSAD